MNIEIVSQISPEFDKISPDSTSTTTLSQASSTVVEYDTLEVTNIPSEADVEYLELYFDSPRSGGCSGAVKNVSMIKPGTAHVQFHDPKGKAFIINF